MGYEDGWGRIGYIRRGADLLPDSFCYIDWLGWILFFFFLLLLLMR